MSFLKQFFRDLIRCLTEPRDFFENRFPEMSFNSVLVFGLIANWSAALLETITRIIRQETLLDGLLRLRDKLKLLPFWKSLPADIWAQNSDYQSAFPSWITDVLGFALAPFGTLFSYFLKSALLLIGVYLLLPKFPPAGQEGKTRDPIDYSICLRLLAAASCAHLVGAITGFLPLDIGPFIGYVYSFILLLIGITVRYRVSGLRALGMVLIPNILVTMVFSCLIGLVLALIFGGVYKIMGNG